MSWVLALSCVLAAAWIPVLWFFFRNWRARKNPISLAICGLILFSAYTDGMAWLYFASNCSPLVLLSMHLMEALVLLFFYVSFRWAKWKYGGDLGPEKRSKS